MTINENVQRSWLPKADASVNSQFAFDVLFQAHGLRPEIASKKTTLDFDAHGVADIITLLPARIATDNTS